MFIFMLKALLFPLLEVNYFKHEVCMVWRDINLNVFGSKFDLSFKGSVLELIPGLPSHPHFRIQLHAQV